MTYTVSITGLRKGFGSHTVLDGVDLAVQTGSVFALLGSNGAGKTTMINICSTLLRPDGGQAVIAGHDLLTDADGVRRSISLTGQYAAVDEVLTARENLAMMARLRHLGRGAAQRRTAELLENFDLADARDRRVKTFSGGMRRRLDLAISLIHRPPLVFLDEPSTGLDPRSREQLWSTIRDLVGGGTTIFLTTQYLEEADRLADRIAMLHNGHIVAEGTADELKASLAAEVARVEFAADAERVAAQGVLGADRATPVRDRLALDVPTDGSAIQVQALLERLQAAGAPAERISLHRPSLDEVFVSFTDGAAITEPQKEAAR